MNIVARPCRSPLGGRLRVPGDKSISHRALLLASLAQGASRIAGFLPSGDCLATLLSLQSLGVNIGAADATTLTVRGAGLRGLRRAAEPLDCVRSGTTMRLLTGILAAQDFDSVLTGEPQLTRRPIRRVVEPLREMGAEISDTNGHAPLRINGRQLRGIVHELSLASAQVKSAILLAGLTAEGSTTVREPGPSRDHTERMLIAMGADVTTIDLAVTLHPAAQLSPLSLHVPGDMSSAAFLMVAAILVPDSLVTIVNVGVNPTRTGLLDTLAAMGGDIRIDNERTEGGEPIADLTMRGSDLRGGTVEGDTVVRMIDEFPILAVAATQADGVTVVREAGELRVKESDRIDTVVKELRTLGAHIEAREDGFVVEGPTRLRGGVVDSHGDHRLAMALTVAGLVTDGAVVVQHTECTHDSYPGFFGQMRTLGADYD